MRVTSNLQWPESPFGRPDRLFGMPERYVVALDVEWTKNYKVRNGSRPFCYSLVLLRWPEPGADTTGFPASFGFKSVYVSSAQDEAKLITELDRDLSAWAKTDSILTGHQLSSDLSVVKAVAVGPTPGIDEAYAKWRDRRSEQSCVIDTRYDVDHLELGKSRRLVDVCGDLQLDVTQPELARASMTKLQNGFLEHRRELVREQLLTLNVRHSLSTAMVACIAMGLIGSGVRNVNDLVHQEMWDIVGYVRDDMFSPLLTVR